MVATCHQITHDAYCRSIPAEIERLAVAVAGADPGAPVPTCPEWSVGDLAEHAGGVHRWAATHLRLLSPVRIPSREMDLGTPEDGRALPGWLREGAATLVDALRGSDPDAPMWAWGADKHARFWARRMLHETTVHRADAEFALGREPAIDPTVAVDGVDEFLDNLPHAAYFAPGVTELRGNGERIALRCPQARWSIRLDEHGFAWEHGDGEGDATIDASAADLYLFVWGRRAIDAPQVGAVGDADLIARWVERSRL